MATTFTGNDRFGEAVCLEIVCGDKKIIEDLIQFVEETNNIKINIVSDETNGGARVFKIKSEAFTPNILFNMGYYYAGFVYRNS